MTGHGDDITELLRSARAGDRVALDAAFRLVYEQLKGIAHKQLGRGSDATLSTTGLVHETYIKLVRADHIAATDRRHFFNLAARAMRQVLLDRARAQASGKRGDGVDELSLGAVQLPSAGISVELIDLDRVLTQLQELDAELAELVDLRLFAGLEFDDIAQIRGVSERTVFRDWRKARAILAAGLDPASQ
ncbi:MAG TPA: ECF-type sigma factor [Candidatus Saccharimonadia bacterium]|nr:ECF-type sigma factor [Candidatus Saccharimonadia bacterium]